MREFLLTITAAVSRPTEITFIVSESKSAPGWNRVKDNPTKLVRTFSNKQPREVYFSATDQLPTDSPLLNENGSNLMTVDLSSELDGVAGVMNPDSQYYVHAYADAKHIASSEQITTADYPSSLPEQYDGNTTESATDTLSISNFNWGTQMWNRGERIPATYNASAGELQRHTVEVRQGEFALFAERFMLPADADDTYSSNTSICSGNTPQNRPPTKISYSADIHTGNDVNIRVDLVDTNTDTNKTLRQLTPPNPPNVPAVLFRNASQISSDKQEEVDDLMISPKFVIDNELTKPGVAQRVAQEGLVLTIYPLLTCAKPPIYANDFTDPIYGVVRVITQ